MQAFALTQPGCYNQYRKSFSMSDKELDLRKNFLSLSASSLLRVAPATSAHLLSSYSNLTSELRQEHGLVNRHLICSACGSVLIPGWTSTLSKIVQPGKGVQQSTPISRGRNQSSSIVRQCSRCCQQTQQSIGIPPKAHRPRAPSTKGLGRKAHDSTQKAISNQLAMNGSKKPRARARKHGNLQAILAGRRVANAAANTDFHLDLMDFMKESNNS